MNRGGWETLSPSRRMWAVLNIEGTEPAPVAIFETEAHAREWLNRMQEHPDEDERLADYFDVLPVGDLAGIFWNSYDAAPPTDSTPSRDAVRDFEKTGSGEDFR